MDDLLHFSGLPKKIIIESAQIQKGTFHDKEGKKSFILEAEYNDEGEILLKKFPSKIENYVYLEKQLICIHTAQLDKTPICKEDFYYEDRVLVKKTKVNSLGITEENETYHYNSDGILEKRITQSL